MRQLNAGSDLIIRQMEREIPSAIESDDFEGTLYHYTDEAGLCGILSSRFIRATHYSQLNDHREFVEGEDLIREVGIELRGASRGLTNLQVILRQAFCDLYDGMTPTAITREFYIASLSDLGDDLGQWRAYGKGGAGFCIGFKWGGAPPDAHAHAPTHLGAMLLRVAYEPKQMRERITRELLQVFTNVEQYVATYGGDVELDALLDRGIQLAFSRAGRVVPRIKHKGFLAESEWRIVVMPNADAPPDTVKTRQGADGPVRYVDFPLEVWNVTEPLELDVVYVGPTQGQTGVAHTRRLLADLGYDPDLAKASAIPLRG